MPRFSLGPACVCVNIRFLVFAVLWLSASSYFSFWVLVTAWWYIWLVTFRTPFCAHNPQVNPEYLVEWQPCCLHRQHNCKFRTLITSCIELPFTNHYLFPKIVLWSSPLALFWIQLLPPSTHGWYWKLTNFPVSKTTYREVIVKMWVVRNVFFNAKSCVMLMMCVLKMCISTALDWWLYTIPNSENCEWITNFLDPCQKKG